MAVTKDSLRCKSCTDKEKRPAARKAASSKGVLALATTFYSFIMMTFLGLISFCVT